MSWILRLRFWSIDEMPGEENDRVLGEFNKNIQFNGCRYVISLPFKPNIDFVPDNYSICLKRLSSLIKKLDINPDLKEEYQNILQSYETEDIIERVSDSGIPGRVHYLTHRPVIRNDKDTTKVRIVFDGSARDREGKSINELLYARPCLLSRMFDVLIRFCLGKYVFECGSL